MAHPEGKSSACDSASAEQPDQFDRIVAIAREVQGRCELLWIVQQVGAARASLVPLDDSKIILPLTLERPGDRHLDGTRSAKNE